jgi:hypothetical protein
MPKKSSGEVPEIAAIAAVYDALKELTPDVQSRVLAYVAGMLEVPRPDAAERHDRTEDTERRNNTSPSPGEASAITDQQDGDLDGISPVAKRWMARNDLTSARLSAVFSLGVDEIDLIAKVVPGKKKTQRMRSVFLLKGLAAYLGTGVARFTHEQLKEACLHYDAFDATNFAANFKSIASEVSGGKETGYTLTARGLASATEMAKSLTDSAREK